VEIPISTIHPTIATVAVERKGKEKKEEGKGKEKFTEDLSRNPTP